METQTDYQDFFFGFTLRRGTWQKRDDGMMMQVVKPTHQRASCPGRRGGLPDTLSTAVSDLTANMSAEPNHF